MGKDAFFVHCSQARPFFMREQDSRNYPVREGGNTRSSAAQLWARADGRDQFAIFEASGQISIIPKRKSIACDDDAAARRH
jgi:hypothetical protein